jgi:hypothetical protein
MILCRGKVYMRLCAAILIMVVVGAFAFWVYNFFGPNGVTDQKAIYGDLQVTEFNFRDKKIDTPFLTKTKNDQLPAVAVETNDKAFPYTWIVLTRENNNDQDGVFKIGSSAPLKITCAEVQEILKKEKVSPKVALYLQRQCKVVNN